MDFESPDDKGKLAARRGRKATGLHTDSGVADVTREIGLDGHQVPQWRWIPQTLGRTY